MDDLISRKAAIEFANDQMLKETGTYTKGRNAGLRIMKSALNNPYAIPSVPAVPLDILSKKLASTCKPCILPFIRCPDENHDCKICNGIKAWEKVIKKWMGEQNAAD